MRYLLLIVLSLSFVTGSAQKKNDLYADLGINERGASATYDRRVTRHLAVGGGVNIYDWRTDRVNLRTSLYGEVRPYWQYRRGLLFVPVDFGIAFYSDRTPQYTSLNYATTGVHFAFGIGYGYRVTRRGAGPYANFMMQGYSITARSTNPALRDYGVVDAGAVLSIGFKF